MASGLFMVFSLQAIAKVLQKLFWKYEEWDTAFQDTALRGTDNCGRIKKKKLLLHLKVL